MNNMKNFEGIEIDQELLERTNPIFNTARMTLFQLAAAGHDDAKDIAQKLNLTREDTQDSKTVKADEDDLFINSVVMEIRYFTNGKIAKESGFTEDDLPCGFTLEPLNLQKVARNMLEWIFPQLLMKLNRLLCHF